MRRWIDIPPVWLALCLVIAWAQAEWVSMGLGFGTTWGRFLGGLLVGGGVLLAVLAVHEMSRQRTTVMPHARASALVTTGIFSRSRNPIYLGDLMILAGMILYWGAALSLPLVPILAYVLERRFIRPEEMRLADAFRADYARYCARTRRWV